MQNDPYALKEAKRALAAAREEARSAKEEADFVKEEARTARGGFQPRTLQEGSSCQLRGICSETSGSKVSERYE